MTVQQKIESLISEAAELPEDAQAELAQTLFEMRAQRLGLDCDHDDERPGFALSDAGAGSFTQTPIPIG